MRPWPFFREGGVPPQATMERDRALFEEVISGAIPGFLRVYGWAVPAVTTGYHQKDFPLFDPTLDLPVLRRPTGGGAVLHVDDVTFSLAARAGDVLPARVEAAGLLVTSAVRTALNACGIHATMDGKNRTFSDVCFARSTPLELAVDGSKVMGLALALRRSHVLLQGVIPLRVDRALSRRVFGPQAPEGAKGLLEISGSFDPDRFVELLRENLARALRVPAFA